MELNRTIFSWIFKLNGLHPLLDALFVFLAKYLPYLLVLIFLYLVLREPKRWKRMLFFIEAATAVILARGILTELIRFFYPVNRPFQLLNFEPLLTDNAPAFPSGHAAFFFALAAVILFWDRRWGIWFGLAAIVIGISRIVAGVHWPLDVLGGAGVGILSGLFIHLFFPSHAEVPELEKPISG